MVVSGRECVLDPQIISGKFSHASVKQHRLLDKGTTRRVKDAEKHMYQGCPAERVKSWRWT